MLTYVEYTIILVGKDVIFKVEKGFVDATDGLSVLVLVRLSLCNKKKLQ